MYEEKPFPLSCTRPSVLPMAGGGTMTVPLFSFPKGITRQAARRFVISSGICYNLLQTME